ncbi:GspH/FimT family protein [Chromatium okenii]|uniref:General secretion pathway GspH domain-containing protein n=1 Tax=Chromatium okenii TaxID=61644 RepID=A0A2S7XVN4_9GAMM|nr:GspH/FimT family protein [Chromatium okenii]PQJ97593.1 hypothetical protein CXB77_00725 [Chromatium okenii]
MADGWVVFVDNDGDGTFDTGDTPLRVGQATNSGVVIDGDTNFAKFVRFKPNGQNLGASTSIGTISIVIAPEKRCIRFGFIGRLRIDSGTDCP